MATSILYGDRAKKIRKKIRKYAKKSTKNRCFEPRELHGSIRNGRFAGFFLIFSSKAPRNDPNSSNLIFKLNIFFVNFGFWSFWYLQPTFCVVACPQGPFFQKNTISGEKVYYKYPKRPKNVKFCQNFVKFDQNWSKFRQFLLRICHSYIKPIERTSWYHPSL